MKSIELRRHAEKDPNGLLTNAGIEASRLLSERLPEFSQVISSDSDRAKLTAKLITGVEPQVDIRAAMYMATPEQSSAINEVASDQGVSFLEAIYMYNDPEIIHNTDSRADALNKLIDETFDTLDENGNGLIISHDLSISAAMAKRGIPIEVVAPLEGYIIYENGDIISLAAE